MGPNSHMVVYVDPLGFADKAVLSVAPRMSAMQILTKPPRPTL